MANYTSSYTGAQIDAAVVAVAGKLSGALGSTDNVLVRADGTGGATAQGTGIVVSDTNAVSKAGVLAVEMSSAGALTATHTGTLVKWTATSAGNITVPKDATTDLPIGTVITIADFGDADGRFTLVAEDGAITIRSRVGLISQGQYAVAGIEKIAANEWVAFGDLKAS